jgi:hypothetical protein
MSGPYAEFEPAPRVEGAHVEVRWPPAAAMADVHREYVAATAERVLHAAAMRHAAEESP